MFGVFGDLDAVLAAPGAVRGVHIHHDGGGALIRDRDLMTVGAGVAVTGSDHHRRGVIEGPSLEGGHAVRGEAPVVQHLRLETTQILTALQIQHLQPGVIREPLMHRTGHHHAVDTRDAPHGDPDRDSSVTPRGERDLMAICGAVAVGGGHHHHRTPRRRGRGDGDSRHAAGHRHRIVEHTGPETEIDARQRQRPQHSVGMHPVGEHLVTAA